MFHLTEKPIDRTQLIRRCQNISSGGFVSFEGWVRNHNHELAVSHLVYEAYPRLAEKEGHRIFNSALDKFDITHAYGVHRTGKLDIEDIAVWIGVSAVHRAAAFEACQYLIDQIKASVPIWKKEFYVDGQDSWVNCPNCERDI